MTAITDLIRQLGDAGASPEIIAIAVEAVENALEGRRSNDRERKRRQREREVTGSHVKSREVTGSHVTNRDTPLVPPCPPSDQPAFTFESENHQPLHPPYIPPSPLKALFAQFWEAYPNKVGKRAAETAFERAMKRADFDFTMLMAGLERAKLSRRWQDGYIPNPATWLNQDRWTDEPSDGPGLPVTPGMMAAAQEEAAFRELAREYENGLTPGNYGRNQGVIIPLPAPKAGQRRISALD